MWGKRFYNFGDGTAPHIVTLFRLRAVALSGGVTVLGKTNLYVGCCAPEQIGPGEWRIPNGGGYVQLVASTTEL